MCPVAPAAAALASKSKRMVRTMSAPTVCHCCFPDHHVPWSSSANVAQLTTGSSSINGTAKVGHKGGIDHIAPLLTAKSCTLLMCM